MRATSANEGNTMTARKVTPRKVPARVAGRKHEGQIGTEHTRKNIPAHTEIPDSTSPTLTAQIRYPEQGGTLEQGAQYLETAPDYPPKS